MPDVSHLSEAERAVLQEVWRRQKEEEEKLRDANRYAASIIAHPNIHPNHTTPIPHTHPLYTHLYTLIFGSLHRGLVVFRSTN